VSKSLIREGLKSILRETNHTIMTSPSPPPSPPDEPLPVMNLKRALTLMGDDRELLREVAGFYVVDSADLLSKLAKAFDTQDAKSAGRAAHSLSSLATNFAAVPCSVVAKAIEEASDCNNLKFARSMLPNLQWEVSRLIAALQREFQT